MSDRMSNGRFEIREVHPEEAAEAAELERICFPANEACAPAQMKARAAVAPELFLAAVDRETGRLAGSLNGLATEEAVFRDAFFEDAGLHKPEGRNIMLLGLVVLPEYRGLGLARELMEEYQRRQKAQGRASLILTCVEAKVKMYEKMGFCSRGISASTWGGEQWYEMCCTLNS